jgi:GxxExxY protein
MEPDAQLDRLAYQTIGAAIEVHRYLGAGFLESIYEAALAIELEKRKIAFQRQVGIDIQYKGVRIGESRLDLLVGNQLVVELKAVDALLPIHKAQVLSYLKAVNKPLGLLINFKVGVLRDGVQRVVLTN